MRNWRPYIPDVVRQMRADGVEEAAVICLAPQNSRTSVGLYRRAVEAEAAGLRIDFTEGWAQHPLLAEAFAERLRPALTNSARRQARRFRCCSRPTASPAAPYRLRPQAKPSRNSRPGQGADPYAEDAKRTAALVAERVPEIPRWWFAFQSQGVSGGSMDWPHRREHPRRACRRRRQGPHPSAHRLSLRPRRDSLRRGYSLSRLCSQTWHPAGAARVAERLGHPGQGNRGAGAAGIDATTELSRLLFAPGLCVKWRQPCAAAGSRPALAFPYPIEDAGSRNGIGS